MTQEQLQQTIIVAVNAGFRYTKVLMARGCGEYHRFVEPSAVGYRIHTYQQQAEHVLLNEIPKYNTVFGKDAVRQNPTLSPVLTDQADILYFEPGSRKLNVQYATKIFGPLLLGLYEYFPGETQVDIVLTVCLPPDHIQFKDDIVAELAGKHVLSLVGRSEMTINIVKAMALSETHAGIIAQELRYVGKGQPIQQEKRFLEQETLGLNIGGYTVDAGGFYPREQFGRRKLLSGYHESAPWGNWGMKDQIKTLVLGQHNASVKNASDWALMDILETKTIPGKTPTPLHREFHSFFQDRSRDIITLVNRVYTHYPSAQELVLFGGGQRDYREFLEEAPALQTIPDICVGCDIAGSTDQPEWIVPSGLFTYGRRYYDVLLAQTEEGTNGKRSTEATA